MNGSRTFSITTLGCKLNQYESECIRQDLLRRNWEYRSFGEKAEFCIINTCTVTGKTDARCRNAVRRARRSSPDATIIVTGCYAETQPGSIEAMEEADMVVGNSGKDSIPSIMDDISRGKTPDGSSGRPGEGQVQIDEFLDHSRAFIKIQEGCDSSCSYCIIPLARGGSRSVEPGLVLDQVKRLERNGIEELVLTGIHIGRYGRDIGGGIGLDDLLEMLLENTREMRFRLSSIEMNEVTGRMIGTIGSTHRLAPHLHIPLQSGDDSMLEAMKRPYDGAAFSEKVMEVHDGIESVSIGTDVIVGFPGETEEAFENTRNLIDSLPLTYLHVFSFSRRPGTCAFDMPDQIDPGTKKSRSRKLIRLGRRKKRRFMISRTGKTEYALIQGRPRRYSRFVNALTGTYCEVSVDCDESLSGSLRPVTITHYSRGRLYGRLADE